MHLRTFGAKQDLKIINDAKSWLHSLYRNYPDFKYDADVVASEVQQILFEGKQPPNEIFSGVFAMPMGALAEDPKLVPVKLIKVNSGAIIPLHSHGGMDHYFLLGNSELIDTRAAYGIHNSDQCVSQCGETHAVTNITDKPSYALIALPTTMKLEFLDKAKSLEYLKSKFKAIAENGKYLPHNIFTCLLYVESLAHNDQSEQAKQILAALDVSNITNNVLNRRANALMDQIGLNCQIRYNQ